MATPAFDLTLRCAISSTRSGWLSRGPKCRVSCYRHGRLWVPAIPGREDCRGNYQVNAAGSRTCTPHCVRRISPRRTLRGAQTV